jgi:PDDEXK-like domain of unknown function (DUF3799)
MDIEEYHNSPGISASQLWLLEESPTHLDKAYCFKKFSDEMSFGNLVHDMLLLPELIETNYVIEPKFDLRTKEGKSAKQEFVESNINKIVIDPDDFTTAQKMVANVQEIAGHLLTGGSAEQAYMVEHDGLIYKCRPDYYANDHVFDLKTIDDISESGIERNIRLYRYDRAAAWYLMVLNLAGHEAERFSLIFAQKKPPYMVKVREFPVETLYQASLEIDALISAYRDYKLFGNCGVSKYLNGAAING